MLASVSPSAHSGHPPPLAAASEGSRPRKMPRCPVLVLNADYRPLSYSPLSLCSWQDAVKAVFLDRVTVLSEYDFEVHSPRHSLRLPSVIALKDYAPSLRRAPFTRYNVFLRDRFRCQYCGERLPADDLTFDHVQPRSRGGRTSWSNVVAACGPCNRRKANRTPSEAAMPLIRVPTIPSPHQLQELGRHFPPNYLHESWRDYLYWDSELEAW